MNEEKVEKRSLDIAEGDVVNVIQSTVRAVDGDHVELQQVGALSIDGERINIDQGASCVIRASNINLNQCVSGITATETATIRSSLCPIVLSRKDVEVKDSATLLVAGNSVKTEGVKTLFVLAKEIDGDVKTLFDWRSALSFGAVIGGLMGLLALLRRK